jgi:hypothetical protein
MLDETKNQVSLTRAARKMPGQASRRQILIRCMAFVGVVVTTVLMGEIVATIALYCLPPEQFVRLASFRQFERRSHGNFGFSYQQGFGVYPTPGYSYVSNKHNRLGFRGDDIVIPKPKGVFRIAVLGGSTTYDSEIKDYSQTYPAQLQRLLREKGYHQAEVVNAGGPSWTSREQILNYATRVSYLDADLIIDNDGLNDLLYRATWPPEQLLSDYTNPHVLVPEFAKLPWYTSLNLFRIPLILSGRLFPPCQIDPFWSEAVKRQGTINILSTVPVFWKILSPTGSRPNIPAGKTLKDVFNATPTAYFANNVGTVVCCAQKKHCGVLLLSVVLDWEGLRRDASDHGEGLRYGVTQMNGVLATVAKENGAAFFDMSGQWPDKTEYWAEFIHNNEAGALFKAGLIADFLVKSRMIR